MIIMMIVLTLWFESKKQRRKRTLMGISSYRLVVLASILSSYLLLLLLSGILEHNLVNATQELNQETFDQLMKSGRNGMVKFYQPWCGHCMRVKPDWDELAQLAHSSIFIADVNCQKETGLCSEHHTGVNYPTIMSYKQRSQRRQQDEEDDDEVIEELYTGGLGLDELRSFVDTQLVVDKCNVQQQILEETESGDISSCNEKEQKYIKKWYPKGKTAWKDEIVRLKNINQKSATDLIYDTKKWMNDRMYLLEQMVTTFDNDDNDDDKGEL